MNGHDEERSALETFLDDNLMSLSLLIVLNGCRPTNCLKNGRLVRENEQFKSTCVQPIMNSYIRLSRYSAIKVTIANNTHTISLGGTKPAWSHVTRDSREEFKAFCNWIINMACSENQGAESAKQFLSFLCSSTLWHHLLDIPSPEDVGTQADVVREYLNNGIKLFIARLHARNTRWKKTTEAYNSVVSHCLEVGLSSLRTPISRGGPRLLPEQWKVNLRSETPSTLDPNLVSALHAAVHVEYVSGPAGASSAPASASASAPASADMGGENDAKRPRHVSDNLELGLFGLESDDVMQTPHDDGVFDPHRFESFTKLEPSVASTTPPYVDVDLTDLNEFNFDNFFATSNMMHEQSYPTYQKEAASPTTPHADFPSGYGSMPVSRSGSLMASMEGLVDSIASSYDHLSSGYDHLPTPNTHMGVSLKEEVFFPNQFGSYTDSHHSRDTLQSDVSLYVSEIGYMNPFDSALEQIEDLDLQ